MVNTNEHHDDPMIHNYDPSGVLSNAQLYNGHSYDPIYQSNVSEKNLKVASVVLPNGQKRDYHIHKNSKGNALFDLVAESEALSEKDYFGLRYEDELGEMTWLYPDKRIQKQLKHKPWNFVFQIKFYPPEPSALADDLTRYLLYLQVRKEVYEGKLPASFATRIVLAAIVMQAEIGDYEAIKQSPVEYEKFLRDQHLIPEIDEDVLTKVREAHKEQKGLTPSEAHQKYLDTAKELAKYGFTFFNAKDSKSNPVIIGVHAHGIIVYKDQLQINRFLWQAINKIMFRGNKFTILVKPGELDPKKEISVHYRLADYPTAKKLYRVAVEHHTFFRLIKPEDKPKGTFLRRWGSDRFRYQGRTYFQAKMASQMFDHPQATVQRTPSGRQVSRSVDDLAQRQSFPASPMHYVDETTQQLTSPEKSKSYSLSLSKADKAKKKADEKLAKKEKKKEEKRRKKEEKERKKHAKTHGHGHGHGGADLSSESSPSSGSVSDAEVEERHVVVSRAVEGPVESLNRQRELGDHLGNIEEDLDNNNKALVKMAPQNFTGAAAAAAAVNGIEANSSGPYTPAKEKDGRVIREETYEQVYRISGTGHAPNFDPNDMSLQSTVDKCIRDTDRIPKVQMVEANILVKENEPLPQALREGSGPHTTVHTWHETEAGPESVTTEVDEHGNKITRTIKTQTTKHTVQKQTYQTYAVDDKDAIDQTIEQSQESTIPLGNKSIVRSPVVHTKTRTVAYEKGSEPHENIDPIGELVSTKTITTGNRTVEILTYKTEKDGVIETRVEHRVTIHSGDDIDHDAELAKALLEATEMSPDLVINRVEVEKQTQR